MGSRFPYAMRVAGRQCSSMLRRHTSSGAAVLDAGSGRRPAIPVETRPPGLRYTGLDLSAAELRRSAAGSYDAHIEADLTVPVPGLRASFDVILSYQVLEHIRPLPTALENMRSYLRPGGTLVALFSGKWSAFGALNTLLPGWVAHTFLPRIIPSRASDSIFPAHYDHCTASALHRVMAEWEHVAIRPLYRGAGYFQFSRTGQRAYLLVENWIARANYRNLATHYVLTASVAADPMADN